MGFYCMSSPQANREFTSVSEMTYISFLFEKIMIFLKYQAIPCKNQQYKYENNSVQSTMASPHPITGPTPVLFDHGIGVDKAHPTPKR